MHKQFFYLSETQSSDAGCFVYDSFIQGENQSHTKHFTKAYSKVWNAQGVFVMFDYCLKP